MKLEVKNAFGRIGEKVFTISRPAPPASKTTDKGDTAPKGDK